MICPNCGKKLPENMNVKMNFCPMCGEKFFEDGKKYLLQIQFAGQRNADESILMVFVDEKTLYEVKPGEDICFAVDAGFHVLKFRHKIRNKTISLLVTSGYIIKAHFNSLSGLIETNVLKIENSENGLSKKDLGAVKLAKPTMESESGARGFDIMLGEDDPEYEIRVTSGLREGVLKLYSERCEFSGNNDLKSETILYKNVVAVRKKMGSIDIQCDGNVHKVYSIPKDIYNEVLAFLTNRIGNVGGKN